MGPLLGDWGRKKYGVKPVKRDALVYLPEYLGHLRDLIGKEQAEALQTDAPVAFVTFRYALAQGSQEGVGMHHIYDLSMR